MELTVAILAGGASRRMGMDKATLLWKGETLLERAARTVQKAALPVLIVGRACPEGWETPLVDFIPDGVSGCGPLGGLEAALRHSASRPVLALACDMPLLSAEALRWLCAQAAAQRGKHGLAVRNGGRWEPLFSVYTPACLPLIESRRPAGRLSLHGLIEAGEFGQADAPASISAQLVNVNTPEDLARLGTLFPGSA